MELKLVLLIQFVTILFQVASIVVYGVALSRAERARVALEDELNEVITERDEFKQRLDRIGQVVNESERSQHDDPPSP